MLKNLRSFIHMPLKVNYCTAPSVHKTLLQQLNMEFTYASLVKNLLKNKRIQSIHFIEWKTRIDMLKNFSFHEADCFKMIKKYPSLLQIPIEDFDQNMRQWFNAELGLKNFHSVLYSCPELLEVDELTIRERIPLLRTYFRSVDALVKLLINCPNVMYEDWDEIIFKINFLTKEKQFTMGDILNGCALTKPIEFIKFRLDLLEKCGIFKVDSTAYHKINKYDKFKHVNPPLKDILLTTPGDFAKIANISPEEYFVCQEMYKHDEDKDFDSDSDSDDDAQKYKH